MANNKKTLVVYFSQSGTTKRVAEQIAETTGATLIEIHRAKKYPKAYLAIVAVARGELTAHARPQIQETVPDFAEYERIVIGFPNWWGTFPMPILTFAEQYDFTGKTVYPFCTHGGGGQGRSTEDITKACKGAKIIKCIDANQISHSNIKQWLA